MLLIHVGFKHMPPHDGIKAHVREKCEKLSRYFDESASLTWNFTIEKQAHIAHCHLVGEQLDVFAEASTHDLFASLDQTVEKLERQILKLRQRKEIQSRIG